MATPLVRMSPESHALLRKMAAESNESMQALVGRALERYRRERFLEEANRAYARVLSNPQERGRIRREREVWDGTLADGLEKRPLAPRKGGGNKKPSK